MIPSPLLVVTDRRASDRPLTETVRAVLDGGARWIWFRDRDLETDARRKLAVELFELVRNAGGHLTIGGDLDIAAEIGADGMHLSAALPPDAGVTTAVGGSRQRLPASALVGLSAHSLSDVRAAAAAGADYVTFSPIFATASKPGYGPSLGLDTLRSASDIGIPIIALGGVDLANARDCVEAGVSGVAVMGGIMRAADPLEQVRLILDALGEARR